MEENVAQEEVVEQVNPELEKIKQQNAESVNLQKMREAKEESDRRLQEMARRLEELEAVQSSKQSQPVQQEEDFDDDDSVVEVRHLKKRDEMIKDLQKDFNQYKQQTEETIISNRLNLDHPDYNKVMTKENIDKLIKDYPSIADTLNSNTNKYTQYKAAYRMIKQFGIYKSDESINQKKIIENNLAKPTPSNSLSGGANQNPLEHANMFANGLTDEVKAKMRALNDKYRMNY